MSQRLLTTEILVRAYRSGVFPMAESRQRQRLYWVDPEWRGIIPLERCHGPRRLRRTVRSGRFYIRCDTAFRSVIETCAEPGRNRHDTWITDEIIDAYTDLFARGYAHSVESWDGARLAGGLYGVSIGAAFFG